MPCPTCGDNLACVGNYITHHDTVIYHCGRCGTLLFVNPYREPSSPRVIVPKLVERCRTFEKEASCMVNLEGFAQKQWHKFGIAEAIRSPQDRKES